MLSPAFAKVRVGVLSLANRLAAERHNGTPLRRLDECYQIDLVTEAQAKLDHYKERKS